MATEAQKLRLPHLQEVGLQRVVAQCVRMSESILHHFLMLTSPQKLLIPFHKACFLVSSCWREYGYSLKSAFFGFFCLFASLRLDDGPQCNLHHKSIFPLHIVYICSTRGTILILF